MSRIINKRMTLHDLRNWRGLTQKEIADRLSVDAMAYSNWETGKRKICRDYYEPLAEAFNVSVPVLVATLMGNMPVPDESLRETFGDATVVPIIDNRRYSIKFDRNIRNFITEEIPDDGSPEDIIEIDGRHWFRQSKGIILTLDEFIVCDILRRTFPGHDKDLTWLGDGIQKDSEKEFLDFFMHTISYIRFIGSCLEKPGKEAITNE